MQSRVGRRRGTSQRSRPNYLRLILIVVFSLLLASIFGLIRIVWFSSTSIRKDSHLKQADTTLPAFWNISNVILNNISREGNQTEPQWSHPIIHIVETRFMQHQASLTNLARSRLVLFKTFCLPTLAGQTLTQKYNQRLSNNSLDPYFLWIIRIDPLLGINSSYAPDVLESMIDLLTPFDNFFLVTSNDNYGLLHKKGYGWREGISGESILSDPMARVLTGNVSILHRAHLARRDRVILETRLDADDGLHIHYLETIQRDALEYLASPNMVHDSSLSTDVYKVKDRHEKASWMFWCTSYVPQSLIHLSLPHA